jgi:hypothetical protein
VLHGDKPELCQRNASADTRAAWSGYEYQNAGVQNQQGASVSAEGTNAPKSSDQNKEDVKFMTREQLAREARGDDIVDEVRRVGPDGKVETFVRKSLDHSNSKTAYEAAGAPQVQSLHNVQTLQRSPVQGNREHSEHTQSQHNSSHDLSKQAPATPGTAKFEPDDASDEDVDVHARRDMRTRAKIASPSEVATRFSWASEQSESTEQKREGEP